MAASEKLKEQLQLVIECLGPQTQFTPAYADNHRAHDTTNTHLNSQQLLMRIQESKSLSNYKIHANTPTSLEGHCLLVLDYDDHIQIDSLPTIKQQRIELHRKFSLDPTYTVKTPTGDGVQEYYLIPVDQAQKIGKWSTTLQLPNFPNVEVKLGLPNLKITLPGPGTYVKEKGAYYQVLEKSPPQVVSEELIRHLTELRRTEIESFIPLTGIESELNSPTNITKMRGFLVDKTGPYVSGLKEPITVGRNNKLYQLARDCFKYNVSKQIVLDSLMQLLNNDPKVFDYPLEEYEFEATIASAYNSVLESKQHHDKAIDSDLAPYKRDGYGNHTISYLSYLKKTKHLTTYTKDTIMKDERLRSMFSELVIFHSNLYYVPSINDREAVVEECDRQLSDARDFGTTISVDTVAKLLSETSLYWTTYKANEFKEAFQYQNANRKMEPLVRWPNFASLHVDVKPNRLVKSNASIFNREFIYDTSKRFYMIDVAAIPPLTADEPPATPKELTWVENMLNRHIKRVVDPNNFEAERDYLLSRMSLLIQRPNTRTENILVLKGEQGTGKSAFFNLFRPLLHSSQTKNFDSAQRLENNFTNLAYVSHFDDISLDFNETVVNKLKNVATSATQYEEKKGIDAIEVIRPVNISMTTNSDITNTEVLRGRRWTILCNQSIPNREEIRKDVFDTFTRLLENDQRLYRVLATYIHSFNIKLFSPTFKSNWQLNKASEDAKGDAPTARVLSTIVNYGFYPPNKWHVNPIQILKKGELVHSNDLINLFFVGKPSKSDKSQLRITSIFADAKQKDAKDRARNFLKELAPLTQKGANAKTDGKFGFLRRAPTIQDLIILLTVFLLDSREERSINMIIAKYGLYEHWNWDGETIPEVENLGSIDPFAYVDLEEFDEDEDEEF